MTIDKIKLTKEKETMLLALYSRALESRSEDPFLRDPWAEAAVERIDYDFEKTKPNKIEALQVVLRARQLDLWTSEYLAEHPDATVLHLGCGLDSRIYRVDPPPTVRWFDLDYAEIINLRRELYPERPNYHMIPAAVNEPGWLDGVPREHPGWIVAEGLTYYLTESEMKRLLNRLTAHFPSGQIAFDAVSHLGFRLAKRSVALQTTGAVFGWWLDNPDDLKKLDPKLELVTELRPRDAAGYERLPLGLRLTLRVMGLFRPLRTINRLLRYKL